MYNKCVKDLWKWAKNIKICHFWPKWPIWPKNGIFWHFWPISVNLWPICYTPLESVKFFWLFKTLKSKIHFFFPKFFQRVPPLDFGFSETYLRPIKLKLPMKISTLGKNFFCRTSSFCESHWKSFVFLEYLNFSIFQTALLYIVLYSAI